jgi:hypothetical protein
MASVNEARPHCVNQMGNTHSKPLAARRGRGTARARHGMCKSALTLHTAAVGTAWSLLGSPRNGQAALYLFQKHFLCWEHIHNCSHCGCFRSDRKRLVIFAQCFPSYRLAISARGNNPTVVCALLYNSQAIHRRHLRSDIVNCGVHSVELEALHSDVIEHSSFMRYYPLLAG